MFRVQATTLDNDVLPTVKGCSDFRLAVEGEASLRRNLTAGADAVFSCFTRGLLTGVGVCVRGDFEGRTSCLSTPPVFLVFNLVSFHQRLARREGVRI